MVDLVVQPPSNWLYQCANIFLLFSYLSPNLLVLRLFLAAGCLCFMLWGLFVLAVSIDAVVYNGVFMIINLVQAGIIVYRMMPIKLTPQLEVTKHTHSHHNTDRVVYQHFFGPGGITLSRSDFHLLTHKNSSIRTLEHKETFAKPGDTGRNLSLLIAGTMAVYKSATYRVDASGHEHFLHELHPMEFVDSPEFVARHTKRGAVFQVLIQAMCHETAESSSAETTMDGTTTANTTSTTEPCTLLVFPYDSLTKLLSVNPTICSVMSALISSDITHKLFCTGESIRVKSKHSVTEEQIHIHTHVPHASILDIPLCNHGIDDSSSNTRGNSSSVEMTADERKTQEIETAGSSVALFSQNSTTALLTA